MKNELESIKNGLEERAESINANDENRHQVMIVSNISRINRVQMAYGYGLSCILSSDKLMF